MENPILDFFARVRLSKEESLHYLGLRSLLYVFQLQQLVTPSWAIFFPERCVYLLTGQMQPLPWLACYKAEVKCWKMKAWLRLSLTPSKLQGVAAYSSAVTHTGVQKRDKSIRSEKEINRSESRQSWSGVCQFNGFVSVCVTMRDLQHGLWYVATYWMYVSRWWAGTCWVLDACLLITRLVG